MIEADVIIVGGGLSGLAVADELTRQGRNWIVLEARDRLAGRIHSAPIEGGAHRFDLGPTWLWPHNERMLAACERFGLALFEQHADGNLVFQDETGAVRRDLAFSTMAGALRIEGGIATLVDHLVRGLPDERLRLDHRVHRIHRHDDRIEVEAVTRGGAVGFSAKAMVLALPPRIIAETITFEPALPQGVVAALREVPTWMAGHAKAIAVFEQPFWRGQGLCGDAISHQGPMMEIHDASPRDGTVGALFGFIGTSVDARFGRESEMRGAVIEQLVELFGKDAATPTAFFYADWAGELETATQADFQPLAHHPAYGMPPTLNALWDGALVFAGAEVAEVNGGYLEGALEAADAAIVNLVSLEADAA
jgi:monoamine oxidase